MSENQESQLLFTHSRRCRNQFTELLRILQKTDNEFLSVSMVEDELGRFSVWAGNIGALQLGTGSLDYRLRNSKSAQSGFFQLLRNLAETLEEIFELAETGGRRLEDSADQDEMDRSDDSDDFTDDFSDLDESTMEAASPGFAVKELWSSAESTLTSLFRLSMVVRNRKRNKFSRWETIGDLDPEFDIQHASHKFPFAAQSTKWLVERVGKANTSRRQYFRYRKNHRDKLAHESKPPPEDEASSVAPSSFQKTVASSIEDVEDFGRQYEVDSDVARSDTSYACSESDKGDTIEVPRPPPECGEGPFECPFCLEIQELDGFRAWKKHVFSDLEPYVCTALGCDVKPFRSRHDWFDHEVEQHKSISTCLVCSKDFGEMDTLREHIRADHLGEVQNHELDSVMRNCCQKPQPLFNTDCPFCNLWKHSDDEAGAVKVSPKEYQRHVGKHMEQLALFALPRLDEPEKDLDLDAGSKTNMPNGGSYSESEQDLSGDDIQEPQAMEGIEFSLRHFAL